MTPLVIVISNLTEAQPTAREVGEILAEHGIWVSAVLSSEVIDPFMIEELIAQPRGVELRNNAS